MDIRFVSEWRTTLAPAIYGSFHKWFLIVFGLYFLFAVSLDNLYFLILPTEVMLIRPCTSVHLGVLFEYHLYLLESLFGNLDHIIYGWVQLLPLAYWFLLSFYFARNLSNNKSLLVASGWLICLTYNKRGKMLRHKMFGGPAFVIKQI